MTKSQISILTLKKEVCANTEKLEPCPFCGAQAQVVELTGRYAVECTRHCVATRIFKEKEKPIEIWNRRI